MQLSKQFIFGVVSAVFVGILGYSFMDALLPSSFRVDQRLPFSHPQQSISSSSSTGSESGKNPFQPSTPSNIPKPTPLKSVFQKPNTEWRTREVTLKDG
ncbi:MAG: hypothetical protein ACOYN2_04585 [Patescibacteria group bacterium]